MWREMRANPSSHELWLKLTDGGRSSSNWVLVMGRKELTQIHVLAGCEQGKFDHSLT